MPREGPESPAPSPSQMPWSGEMIYHRLSPASPSPIPGLPHPSTVVPNPSWWMCWVWRGIVRFLSPYVHARSFNFRGPFPSLSNREVCSFSFPWVPTWSALTGCGWCRKWLYLSRSLSVRSRPRRASLPLFPRIRFRRTLKFGCITCIGNLTLCITPCITSVAYRDQRSMSLWLITHFCLTSCRLTTQSGRQSGSVSMYSLTDTLINCRLQLMHLLSLHFEQDLLSFSSLTVS